MSLDTHVTSMVRAIALHSIAANLASPDTTGSWLNANTFDKGTFEFFNQAGTGSLTFSSQICGSTSLTRPQDTDDGFAIGSAVTNLGAVPFTGPVRWVKVKTPTLSVSGGAQLGIRLQSVSY
jgi:hypothetical protein